MRLGILSGVLLLTAAAVPQAGRQVQGIKTLTMGDAYLPGQREVILGPKRYRDTVMAVQFSREYGPRLDGDNVLGSTWDEHAEGYVRWSLLPDTFEEKPCQLLKTEGVFKRKLGSAPMLVQHIRNYWLAADGKILRQFDLTSDPNGHRTATATFGEDSIDIKVVAEDGKERTTTLYPGPAMERLQAQFLPMMDGATVKMEQKRYAVLNPFTGGFEEYEVRRAGKFAGPYMNIPFKGYSFDIAGPKEKQRAFVSEEGDLVKVELPKSRFLVLTTAPESKEDSHWKVDGKPKKGGG